MEKCFFLTAASIGGRRTSRKLCGALVGRPPFANWQPAYTGTRDADPNWLNPELGGPVFVLAVLISSLALRSIRSPFRLAPLHGLLAVYCLLLSTFSGFIRNSSNQA